MTAVAATRPPVHVLDYVRALNPERGIWIDGHGLQAVSGRTLPVEDPATARVIAEISDGQTKDAEQAVETAARALPSWAASSPRKRADILRHAFDIMMAESDTLASIITWENGKSLADARAEVKYAADFLRWFSEEAVRTEGTFSPAPAGGTRMIVNHRPVGVVALVTPWNFPAAMVTRKIGPALAAGCTAVLKPAAETPLTALAIVQILTRAGLPDGVVNLVPTSDAARVVTAWLEHPQVRKISFTGSTPVGRVLLRQAADRVVNTGMELGGNAPFIVAADADIDAAVVGALEAKLRNGGQACTAANRLYIHQDVVETFAAKFGSKVEALVVGAGGDATVGPLINARAVDKLSSLVDAALEEGARISHRAPLPKEAGGFYYPPTVLRDVSPDATILKTEVFGPVAPIVTWSSTRELLTQLNGTEFGLASYVFSSDLKWAMQLGEAMDVGMVGINRGVISDASAPFGGTKQSGIGREGAREGLRQFQETQYFSIDWSQHSDF